jgi:hypothetical protein
LFLMFFIFNIIIYSYLHLSKNHLHY